MKVFIDTSAFVSLLVQNEQSHEKVAEKYNRYKHQRAIFFTSRYILDELFTRLLYFNLSNIRNYIQTIHDAIETNELITLEINETIFDKAINVFVKFSEHKISFTDAASYVLYKDFNLEEIFTLDTDFKKIHVKTSF